MRLAGRAQEVLGREKCSDKLRHLWEYPLDIILEASYSDRAYWTAREESLAVLIFSGEKTPVQEKNPSTGGKNQVAILRIAEILIEKNRK
ncbi:hypothetical protein [Candidatus Methylacidiphilum infernorum]|uniref:Uncharacterized protein n=1 Tax=Methylacidiphilum infernorum (isolate V4) TaxID=481448 RepID=B3DZ77_METI4|nr:hypothetical protein [Candidatus Methylacidiphilum infernorum]ACD84169.1 Hypothetical protein Minf_2115 [Methylacidiphilum infernorum V4]